MTELRFRVPGMTCEHCVQAVRRELEKTPGVDHVSVDLDSKAVVIGGEDVKREAAWAAVAAAGYTAES